MKKWFVSLLLVFVSVPGFAQSQPDIPVAGTDYIEIPMGKPLEPVDGKVVVEEFFNYICPACASFEPLFVTWAAQLPSYVELVHIPASFRADFVPYAQAYYAAETYGLVDETHAAVYTAIHRSRKLPAEGQRPDPERVAEFYGQFGVDPDEFLATMKSFGVDLQIRRAVEHMRRSRVAGTPSILVNGRYLVRGSSFDAMLRTASYLIEQEKP